MAQSILAPIERVLVGRSHAEITRIAELARGDFPRSVEIRGLPLTLDDGSVRIRVEGGSVAARAAHVSIVAQDRAAAEPQDERAVAEAEREVARLRRSLEATTASLERVRSVSVVPRPSGTKKDGPPRAPVAERIELAAFVRARADRLSREILEFERALRIAEEALAAALQAKARASSDRPLRGDELKKAIVVDLDATSDETDAPARLVVSYSVPGARWMPEYTLRIADARAELEVRAVVQQKTGEDWAGVTLSLSTALEQRRTEIPELTSLRIGRAQRGPHKRGFRAPPEGAFALYEDYERAKARALEATQTLSLATLEPDMPASLERAAKPGAPALLEQQAIPFEHAKAEPPSDMPAFQGALARQGGASRPGAAPPTSATGLKARMALSPASVMAMPTAAKSGGAFGALAASAGAIFAGGGAAAPAGGVGFGAPPRDGGRTRDERAAASALDVEVAAGSLAYASMRMGGPDDAERGSLRVLADTELYVETRAELRALVRIDVARAIDSAMREAAAIATAPPPPRHTPVTDHDGFDFAFVADGVVDVPSDGEGHATPITRASAPIKLLHVAVPRESRSAFRCAEVQSPLEAPLLTGPLDVYEGKDFLLSTRLPTTAPRGVIKLGLGVDGAVKIARNIEFAESVTGLMRGSLDLRHTISVEISNQRSDTLHLDVRERLPVVREKEEDIKVDVLAVEPRWSPYEEDDEDLRGGYVWHAVVPPGEKKKLAADYVIRIAGKHELVGGNRRES